MRVWPGLVQTASCFLVIIWSQIWIQSWPCQDSVWVLSIPECFFGCLFGRPVIFNCDFQLQQRFTFLTQVSTLCSKTSDFMILCTRSTHQNALATLPPCLNVRKWRLSLKASFCFLLRSKEQVELGLNFPERFRVLRCILALFELSHISYQGILFQPTLGKSWWQMVAILSYPVLSSDWICFLFPLLSPQLQQYLQTSMKSCSLFKLVK